MLISRKSLVTVCFALLIIGVAIALTDTEEPENISESETWEGFAEYDLQETRKDFVHLQSFARTTLESCKRVNSYGDYVIFNSYITAMLSRDDAMPITFEQYVERRNTLLTLLALSELGEVQEVTQKIIETRYLYLEIGVCMEELVDKYE